MYCMYMCLEHDRLAIRDRLGPIRDRPGRMIRDRHGPTRERHGARPLTGPGDSARSASRSGEGEDVTDIMEWTAVLVGAVVLESICFVRGPHQGLHVARRQAK